MIYRPGSAHPLALTSVPPPTPTPIPTPVEASSRHATTDLVAILPIALAPNPVQSPEAMSRHVQVSNAGEHIDGGFDFVWNNTYNTLVDYHSYSLSPAAYVYN